MTDVTVVLPFHDHRRWVVEAFESALTQTRPPDEILLVDNRGTDGSRAALESAARGARVPVRFLRPDGETGAWRGRILGLRQARTEWVAFLDADDRWKPERLARGLASAVPGVGVVAGPVEAFADEPGLDVAPWATPHADPGRYPAAEAFRRLLHDWDFIVTASAGMVLRAPCVERLARLCALDGIDDQPLWGVLAIDRDVVLVPERLVEYRIRSVSVTKASRPADVFRKFLRYYAGLLRFPEVRDVPGAPGILRDAARAALARLAGSGGPALRRLRALGELARIASILGAEDLALLAAAVLLPPRRIR